jgi:hypothetical protein
MNIIFTVVLACCVLQCSQLETSSLMKNNSPKKEILNCHIADSIVIAWDKPSNYPDSVAYYELFYRTSKETTGWTMAKREISATEAPKVTVHRSDVDSSDTVYFFAVRSVGKNGLKSDFHSSADSMANPPFWCVLWK